jgi:hypothetical protein
MNQEIMAINLATVQIHFDAEKAGDWEKIKTMYTDDFDCLDRFATEDRVVDESIFTFEVAKEGAMPLPVGTKAKLRLVHIFEMREGKVSRELVMESPPQPL